MFRQRSAECMRSGDSLLKLSKDLMIVMLLAASIVRLLIFVLGRFVFPIFLGSGWDLVTPMVNILLIYVVVRFVASPLAISGC